MGDPQQDPSMEEILASIKRVIREDGRVPGHAPTRAARRPLRAEPAPAEEDVLELDEAMAQIGAETGLEAEGEEGLASANTTVASREALAALSALRQRETSVPVAAAGNGALEAVVREMLRPLIKDWLDENLPGLVEELVTREISRIVGKR